MTNKTLSERIAECRQDIIDAGLEPEHDIGFQIIEELQAENKIWQEMVDSTNQTNQALIKRLRENNEECVEPVSIWKIAKEEIYRCNFSSYQIWLYEIFINSFEQMQKDIEENKRK